MSQEKVKKRRLRSPKIVQRDGYMYRLYSGYATFELTGKRLKTSMEAVHTPCNFQHFEGSVRS